MKTRTLLFVFALFLPVALGVWKWVNALEARLEERIAMPQPLQMKIAKGNAPLVRFTPPLTDTFTLSISGLSNYKSGYKSENWQVKRLEFRVSSTQKWKTLPEKLWRTDWHFIRSQFDTPPVEGKLQQAFSVYDDVDKGELLAGQYQSIRRLNGKNGWF